MAKAQVTENIETQSNTNSLKIKQEQKAFANMTVKQKLDYLNQKVKQGTITPDEEKLKKELEEQSNNGKSVDAAKKNLAKTGHREVEDIKFIKEQDILDYMYNEWLIAGANWLLNKTYKGIVYTGDYLGDKLANTIRNWQTTKHHKPNDSTTAYAKDADNSWDNYNKKAKQQIENDDKATYDRFDKFNRCEFTDEDRARYPKLCEALENATPKDRAKLCNAFCQRANERANELKIVHYMASALARAQMLQNTMSQENPEPFNEQVFNAMCQQNSLLIDKQLELAKHEGNDLNPIINKLYKNIEKANKIVNKSLDKGKYQGNQKKSKEPIENENLLAVNEFLGLNEIGAPLPSTVLNFYINTPQGPQKLNEAASANQTIDKNIHSLNQDLSTPTSLIMSEKEKNARRKAHFQARIARMKDDALQIPDKLRKKTNDNENQETRHQFQPYERSTGR